MRLVTAFQFYLIDSLDDVITKDIKELSRRYKYAEIVVTEIVDADLIKYANMLEREFNVSKERIKRIVSLCVVVDDECVKENIYFEVIE